MRRQHTIARPAHAIGVGVHSGVTVAMTLRPAPADAGVRFVRVDLSGSPSIPACAARVSDTRLTTTLAQGATSVMTVEHLLAALWGAGVDNVLVDLTAPEVPILDGSAAPLMDLIAHAGVVAQAAPRRFLRIKRSIEVAAGQAVASLAPFDGFRAGYTLVANHPVYARYPARAVVDFGQTNFAAALSRARTFGLQDDLRKAHAMNRCRGSTLDNAIGISTTDILNPEGLRFPDEFARHKLLDALGDLYLLGHPLLGEFEGYGSGHALNNQLVRAVLASPDAWELVTQPQAVQHHCQRVADWVDLHRSVDLRYSAP
jgi:UDP-3-O-[3-hydroxymyristoyl] N-acetylglucosamine deacetylase